MSRVDDSRETGIEIMTGTLRNAHARTLLLAAGAAVVMLLTAAPALGQTPDYRWTVGWGGSWLSFSPLLQADGERLESNIGLESGIAGSLFVDRWLNSWVGIRADGLYHRGEIRAPEQAAGLDVWTASAGLTIRPFGDLLMPVAPFAFGTGGIISYGLGGPSREVADGVIFDADATEQFLIQLGGGVDILLFDNRERNRIGVRLEGARMMPWNRPFHFEEEAKPGRHGFWRFTLGLTASVLPY